MAKTKSAYSLNFECEYAEIFPIAKSSRKIVRAADVEADTILQWVKDSFNPEDVFSTTQLEKWAESEGYTKGGTSE